MNLSPEERLNRYLTQWDLTMEGPPRRTRNGLVCYVRTGGEAAVLKVTLEPEEQQGIRLLACAEGRGGMVPVLRSETDAVLMPRLLNVPSLAQWATVDDQGTTTTLVQALMRLHREMKPELCAPFTNLDVWFDALFRRTSDRNPLLAVGRTAALGLLASKRDISLLHGDFHHENLMVDRRGEWMVIDPKGLVGERTFDFVNILRNPEGEEALAVERFGSRVTQICGQANLEEERLLMWTLAFCCLSAVWHLEDGVKPAHDIRLAGMAARNLGINM